MYRLRKWCTCVERKSNYSVERDFLIPRSDLGQSRNGHMTETPFLLAFVLTLDHIPIAGHRKLIEKDHKAALLDYYA